MPDVFMPRLSDTMEEGVLSQWVKHEGDQVRKGDVLAVIETDKAAMDMEAYDEGVLTRSWSPKGASVPIGTPIAVIGEAAADQSPRRRRCPPPIKPDEQWWLPRHPHRPPWHRPRDGRLRPRWPASSPASAGST